MLKFQRKRTVVETVRFLFLLKKEKNTLQVDKNSIV